MYTIQVERNWRDKLIYSLREHRIGASVHFDPPVHLQPYYRKCGTRRGMLPVTERLAKELITLPIYPDMAEAEQDWVVHCLNNALKKSLDKMKASV